MIAYVADVRVVGGLPDDTEKLPDHKIRPHLKAAGRELTQWIGDYDGLTGADRESAREAECCLCMYYLLPVLNTFYTQGISGLQKEIGEMDFVFHSPDDLGQIRASWMERARKAVARISNDDGDSGPRWYAI